jgi:hypothetical protein
VTKDAIPRGLDVHVNEEQLIKKENQNESETTLHTGVGNVPGD